MVQSSDNEKKPIPLPEMKPIWWIAATLGTIFWFAAFILWFQKELDETLLFYFNPARNEYTTLIQISAWLSAYGMAMITVVYLTYLIFSQKFSQLNAPLTIYLFIIMSLGLSGIAGDLLKEVIARPRPIETYAEQIIVFSNSATPSFPSGHTTKSVALALPFLLLVSNHSNWHKIIKGMLIFLAFGVSVSRILLGAHYLSDVVAGFAMAFTGLPFTMLFAIMVLKQASLEKLPLMSRIWGILLIALTVIFMMI
jgi:undecaprenyl-diphosphatase